MKFLNAVCFFIIFSFFTIANAQVKNTSSRGQYVQIESSLGAMIFKLSAETPKHTANFIKLAKKGYFDSFDFNRVIKGFVIQGGETDSAYAAMEKAGQVIERILPEFNTALFHQKGALAAGRDDNKEKSSFLGQIYVVDGKKYSDEQLDAIEKKNGIQFSEQARKVYKEIGGTPSLDQNYTVFGQMISGWEVLDLIAGQQKNKNDRPFTKIKLKATVLSKKDIGLLKISN